jgi:hypothetical protein
MAKMPAFEQLALLIEQNYWQMRRFLPVTFSSVSRSFRCSVIPSDLPF